MNRSLRLGVCVVGVVSAGSLGQAFEYQVFDLGVWSNVGSQSNALAVNNLGQVVLQVNAGGGQYQAKIWTNGVLTDLGYLGTGVFARPAGINDAGQVSGMAHTVNGGGTRAFRYSGGVMSNLGSLNGTSESYAWGINRLGHVTGYSYGAGGVAGTRHAFLYDGTNMLDLGFGGGATDYSFGRAVNETDQVAGFTFFSGDTSEHAAVWSAGTWTAIPMLGTGTRNQAWGLNDAGQATGYSFLSGASGDYHAFLYSGGVAADLGTVVGNGLSLGRWINNSGTVVGWHQPSLAAQAAMIYRNGVMQDLTSLVDPTDGWFLKDAQGISDTGYIVGYGTLTSGGTTNHVYLLKPVPEPATIAVLGFGALALLRRRRK